MQSYSSRTALLLCLLVTGAAAASTSTTNTKNNHHQGYTFSDHNGHGLVRSFLDAVTPALHAKSTHSRASTDTHRLLSSHTTPEGMHFATYAPIGRSFTDMGLGRDFQFGRSYDLKENSSGDLLNRVIEYFLPYINSYFQRVMPDPYDITMEEVFDIDPIRLPGGVCEATAGAKIGLGSLAGMKNFTLDYIRLIPGTEEIRPGWSEKSWCLETVFDAMFEVQLSADAIQVPDMTGGVNAGVCSYAIDEELTGGIRTMKPMLYTALKLKGSLLGTLLDAKLENFASIVQVGFESIQAYLDDVPPSVNFAIANITSEMSILAKDQIVQTVFQKQMVSSMAPQMNTLAHEAFTTNSVEFSVKDALWFNGMFTRNAVGNAAKSVSQQSLDFLTSVGFGWRGSSHDDTEDKSPGWKDPALAEPMPFLSVSSGGKKPDHWSEEQKNW